MKKTLVISLAALLFSFVTSAQDYTPTVTWPYVNPDFFDGEITFSNGKVSKSKLNVHLGQGTLHFIDNKGMISETSTVGAVLIKIGEDEYNATTGKLMKILAKTETGLILEERLANYSAITRNDGAYGGNSASYAQGHSYDENYGNYGYLVTNVYEDLYAQKEYGEELPVVVNRFFSIDGNLVPAQKKNVSSLEGLDKKAFAAFLKEEKIDWKKPQDLLKVLQYVEQ